MKHKQKVSISIGLHIIPKGVNESLQRAKDNKRFLSYGPNTDTCLCNVFDANQVSRQCVSALIYLNDTPDTSPFKYANESEYSTKQRTVSFSISCAPIFILILCYILINEFYSESDDDGDDQRNCKYEIDSEYDMYTLCADNFKQTTRETAVIAVPLEVV